ncbi:MAG: UTP--glucose-1-phosphate uridylyltransferase [Dehalococcoidia bacterium]
MSDLRARIDQGMWDVLQRYGFDEAQLLRLQSDVREGRLSAERNRVTGRVEPPAEGDVISLPAMGEQRRQEAYDAGSAAIRDGAVAMAVLNGGMATRFGGVVKGIVEAVDGRSFLEWKLIDANRTASALGGRVPCVIMNSFATEPATREYLATARAREPTIAQPIQFSQYVSLRLNRDGSLFLEEDGWPSLYAPGHGDFLIALRRSGTLRLLQGHGIRYVMLSNVDNLGARIDPVVIGAHVLNARPITVEVAPKAAGDAGGAPARVNGRMMHVEGFRFPPDFDQDSIPVFNTNSFVFDLDALDQEFPLSWFYVEKSIDGQAAVQLERLVNELTSFLPSTFLTVPRAGLHGRFFPVKAPEDLEAGRPALRAMLATSVVG